MTVATVRKALVPLGVLAVAYVAKKLGVNVPADQAKVIVAAVVTSLLTYLIPNG